MKVVEKPSVQDYKIEGNDEISADDLKETIEVKRYAILDLTAVRKTVKKIQEKYTEKGFYLAEVTFRIEDRPDNQVVVVFVVNERAKVQVRRIHFVGNDNVSQGGDPPLHADPGGRASWPSSRRRAPTRRTPSSATSRPSRRSTSRRATSASRWASPPSRSAPTGPCSS